MEVFDLMLAVLLIQTLIICFLAYRLRKPDIPPTTVRNQVKEDTSAQTDDDDDVRLRARPTKTHRSNYKYYVIFKAPSFPPGIYKCTWDDILQLLPDKVYPAKGLKLKGAHNLEEACGHWNHYRRFYSLEI